MLDPEVGHALTGPRRGQNEQRHQPVTVGSTRVGPVPTFDVVYDKRIVAVGCYSQTFNTPRVRENATFLKDVGNARK